MLAAAGDALPPIIVHGGTMRVVDGDHRVAAAVLQGRHEIAARIFEGTSEEAFVLAVQLNVVHGRGLLLSHADRTAAAARLVTAHPQWSNRMIASLTCLSAGTIGRVRGQWSTQGNAAKVRVGKDGRARPVDGSNGRLKAYEMLISDPSASIRDIAQRVGVSPSTVHDVRKRIQAGEEPVPRGRRPASDGAAERGGVIETPARPGPEREAAPDPEAIIAALMKDPSLRYNNLGRRLIRWLDSCWRGVAECPGIAAGVPSHSIDSVAALARECAHAWSEFAAVLEERSREIC
jgi:transposase